MSWVVYFEVGTQHLQVVPKASLDPIEHYRPVNRVWAHGKFDLIDVGINGVFMTRKTSFLSNNFLIRNTVGVARLVLGVEDPPGPVSLLQMSSQKRHTDSDIIQSHAISSSKKLTTAWLHCTGMSKFLTS